MCRSVGHSEARCAAVQWQSDAARLHSHTLTHVAIVGLSLSLSSLTLHLQLFVPLSSFVMSRVRVASAAGAIPTPAVQRSWSMMHIAIGIIVAIGVACTITNMSWNQATPEPVQPIRPIITRISHSTPPPTTKPASAAAASIATNRPSGSRTATVAPPVLTPLVEDDLRLFVETLQRGFEEETEAEEIQAEAADEDAADEATPIETHRDLDRPTILHQLGGSIRCRILPVSTGGVGLRIEIVKDATVSVGDSSPTRTFSNTPFVHSLRRLGRLQRYLRTGDPIADDPSNSFHMDYAHCQRLSNQGSGGSRHMNQSRRCRKARYENLEQLFREDDESGWELVRELILDMVEKTIREGRLKKQHDDQTSKDTTTITATTTGTTTTTPNNLFEHLKHAKLFKTGRLQVTIIDANTKTKTKTNTKTNTDTIVRTTT